jgi:large subunit ribosomal protein L3
MEKMAVPGIIGRKVGMTQIYADDGRAVPVTVVQAGPCVVVQCRTPEKDGYAAAQLGLVEERKVKRVTKPMKGHFDKASLPPCRVLREVRLAQGDEAKVGDKVRGTSKGKGVQGVIKRHHFGGGKATHGSMFHRAPGSIGASAYPSRVLKGMRAAGHMGSDRVTAKSVTVVGVDADSGTLLLRGSVPGAGGGLLVIRKGARQAPGKRG